MDRWAFYWRALESNFDGWDSGDAPFPGFYRFRYHRRDIWRPCAIWDLDGRCVASEGVPAPSRFDVTHFVEGLSEPGLLWGRFAWNNPITEEQYRHALATGAFWDSLRATADAGGGIVADVRQAEAIGPIRRT